MTLKRILLIAPDHKDISWPVELEAVGQKHQVVALTGNVTQERVTRATTGQRFDVVHVASHGSEQGIALSDGLMTMGDFGQVARHVRAELVFFNACNSARLGQYMIDIGLRAVLSWTVAVADSNGLRTAAYFYDELAVNDDLRLAYDKVNPRDGSLSFLTGPGYLEDVIRPVVEQLNNVGQQVGRLAETVTTQGKALRYVAGAVVAAIVLALVLVVVGVVSAQDGTIPPVQPGDFPTETPLPGCGSSGGQPKKCQTPTDTPVFEPLPPTDTPVAPTATFAATVPPDTATALPESPTATIEPTVAVATATPTEAPMASSTAIDTPTVTEEPKPASTKTPTETPAPTWTPTAQAKTPVSEPEASKTVVSDPVLPTSAPSAVATADLRVVTVTPTKTPIATRSAPGEQPGTLEPCW